MSNSTDESYVICLDNPAVSLLNYINRKTVASTAIYGATQWQLAENKSKETSDFSTIRKQRRKTSGVLQKGTRILI